MGDAVLADLALTSPRSPTSSSVRDRPSLRARRHPSRHRHRSDQPLDRGPGTGRGLSGRRDPRPRGSLRTLALRNQLRLSRPAATTSPPAAGSGSACPPRSERARAAEPPCCLRARRGLRPIRDPEPVDRRRLRRAYHLFDPAQRRVRDPQVVRDARGLWIVRASTCPRLTVLLSPVATASTHMSWTGVRRSATL